MEYPEGDSKAALFVPILELNVPGNLHLTEFTICAPEVEQDHPPLVSGQLDRNASGVGKGEVGSRMADVSGLGEVRRAGVTGKERTHSN